MENDTDLLDDYTDEELLGEFLEMSPGATDREVEAKIHQKIRQHPEHTAFFEGIYQRLFDLQEGLENRAEVLQDKKSTATDVQQATSAATLTVNELYGNANPKGQQSIVFTKSLDYVKGGLNPTFNNTIQRVLVIDSRCRDRTIYPSSTDFTLNLTENLRNVLGLNFYYINLPYTWYTISKAFGANFFYLNGNAPGIADVNHAIKVAINPGNYTTSQSLVDAVNGALDKLSKDRPDIQFGTTNRVTLDSTTAGTGKATMTWDISNRFGDASYELFFPYWTSPEDWRETNLNGGKNVVAQLSIPGFYGFLTDRLYPLCSLYSNYRYSVAAGTRDLTAMTYSVTGTNNKFTIYNKDNNNLILDQIEIVIPVGSYNINDLVLLTTNALRSHPKLNPQYTGFFLETIGETTRRFRLTVQLQRLKTANNRNQKQFVEFPTETQTIYSKLWSGKNSLFMFDDLPALLPLNSTAAEIGSVEDDDTIGSSFASFTYNVADSPTLVFKCQKYPPGVADDFNDKHSYTVTVPNDDEYTLKRYLEAINAGIRGKIPSVSSSLFAYDYDGDKGVYATIGFEEAFTTKDFVVDVGNSVLTTIFGLPPIMNCSQTNVFTATFPKQSVYTIDNNNRSFKVTSTIFPQATLFLPYAVNTPRPPNLPNNGSFYQYRDLPSIQNAFNEGEYGFKSMTNPFTYQKTASTVAANPIPTEEIPLYGLSLALSTIEFKDVSNDLASCTLTWNITNKLEEIDYEISLEGESWKDNLGFDDATFDLRDTKWSPVGTSISTIYASDDVTTSTIFIADDTIGDEIVQNNQIWIQPRPNADSLDPVADRVVVSIESKTYNRFSLVRALNFELAQHPTTVGSRFTWCGPDLENIRIDWNINKVYTARDYTLTFFDLYEFSSCVASTSSINTTSLTTIRWDQTLGWLLGYRKEMSYNLGNNTTSEKVSVVVGDTPVNTNLYNQMHVVLDDFASNHMNDGLVTLSPPLIDVPALSYANRLSQRCENALDKGRGRGQPFLTNTNPASTEAAGRLAPLLTQPQLYSALATNQALRHKSSREAQYISSPPNVKDMFALIPLKLAGLQVGQTYTEFGGTLQQSNRKYFGPVNISRVGIKLMSDRGDIVDLNNNDWSVGIICDISVQPT